MVLLTPALSLAGLAPIIAGHTIYYAFPYLAASTTWTPTDTQVEQRFILIAATLALALFTDRLLLMRLGPESSLKEKMLAAIPYLPALVLLLVIAVKMVPVPYLPSLISMASLALLLPIWLHRGNMPGLNALGLGMAILSVAMFIYTMYANTAPAYSLPWYLPLLGLYFISLVLMERLAFSCTMDSPLRQTIISYSLIALIAAIGATGLYSWNNSKIYFVALLGLSALLAVFGHIFRTRSYYHVALTLTLFALGFMLLHSNPNTNVAAGALMAWRQGN